MLNLSPQQFVTWDEPIEMLYACHDKVKHFCRQLEILPDYLDDNGCNPAVKNDVKQILNYFNHSAPLHHDDEELDFFPTLIQHLPDVQSAVAELASQHDALHQQWSELAEQLEALLAETRTTLDRALIKRFVSGYHLHISMEEPLFEQGRAHLMPEELNAMGKIMANRRQTHV